MVRWAIDEGFERVPGDHVGVVNKDGPKVDRHEKNKIENAMEREYEDEEMIWDGLKIAVDGGESMRCEWCRN